MREAYLTPYINFQGRAREAFELYHQVFGGELSLFKVDENGKMKAAGSSDPIGWGRLVAEGVRIYGSDGNPDYPITPGDTVAITLASPDKAGVTKAFETLAQGGTVSMPFTEAPWGTAGWLKDRFGITWNIEVTPPRKRGG
jgi:PhnB protein